MQKRGRAEICAVFGQTCDGLDVISQAELNVSSAEEPHPTFLENALAKARHASRLTRSLTRPRNRCGAERVEWSTVFRAVRVETTALDTYSGRRNNRPVSGPDR